MVRVAGICLQSSCEWPRRWSARPNNPSAWSSRLFSDSVCFLSLFSGSPSTGSCFQGTALEGSPGWVGTGPSPPPSPHKVSHPLACTPPVPASPPQAPSLLEPQFSQFPPFSQDPSGRKPTHTPAGRDSEVYCYCPPSAWGQGPGQSTPLGDVFGSVCGRT